MDLRQLPDHAAHRAGSGGDHHGFAGLGRADVQQTDPGRHAGHAQRPKVSRERNRASVGLAQRSPVGHTPGLPAERADHLVAGRELRVIGLDNFPGGAAHHDLADFDRFGVRLGIRHADAHVGVERQPFVPDQHLVRSGLGDGGLFKAKIAFLDPREGTAGEDDSLVHFHHGLPGC
jgi:hypothetical protein